MIVSIVRFRSELPDEDIWRVSEERAPRYRQQPGLVQKYYLSYREAGAYGAVFVWESPEALAAFRESDLFRTIGEAYRLLGAPDITVADVGMTLR